jgi:tripartite-type tricarboxylate transporter receptor subunit TctC
MPKISSSKCGISTVIGLLAVRVALGGVLAVSAVAGSRAQSSSPAWPQRAVRFILPFGPASATDIAARVISDDLAKRWAKPVIIENRPGGDNLIAISAFLSANDDHVLLFTSSAAFLAHPYVHKKLSYNFERDFAPIAKVADTILVVAVPATLGVDSVAQFVALAKSKPDAVNLAAATGLPEFAVDAFLKAEGLTSVRIPYRDLAAATRDLGEGRIQFLLTSYASVRPLAESGKLRIIAAGSRMRTLALKDTPSILESGYPTLAVETSVALFGRPEMPSSLRMNIAGHVMAVLGDAKIAGRISDTGQDVGPAGPDDLVQTLKRQRAHAEGIAKSLGLVKAED